MKFINPFKKKRETIAEMTVDEVTEFVDGLCDQVKQLCLKLNKPKLPPMILLQGGRWKFLNIP